MTSSLAPLRTRLVRVAGTATLGVGCLVLVGWAVNIPLFKSILPGLATMKANTALCFVLAGTSLLAMRQWGPRLRLAGLASAVAVATVGLLTLVEWLARLDLGIDQLLFRDGPETVSTLAPGRMAPATALLFVLLGTALVLLRLGRGPLVVQGLTGLALLISLLTCVGYLYGVKGLYQIEPFTSVAVHTAATFLVLCAGVLAVCPERGPVRLSIDAAVPCGLAVNELVSNCLKYAFPDHRSGVVRIRLAQVDEEVVLVVQDDGIGLHEQVTLRNAKTFGLRLVSALADQLHGKAQIDRCAGTTVQILFPASRKQAGRGGQRS